MVVSVHAYNLGVVKYDYKIVCVVARILFLEVRKLCTSKQDEDQKKMVKRNNTTRLITMRSQPIVLRLFCSVVVVVVVVERVFMIYLVLCEFSY